MRLLYTKTSPFARKARIIALEKKIPLELIEEIPYEKRPELLELNPAGKIPVLLLDDETPLIDSPVICEYLDLWNDDSIFIPRSGNERFPVLHRAALADAMIEAALALYLEEKNHGKNVSPEFQKNKELAVHSCLKYFDHHTNEMDSFRYDSVALACALGSLEFRIPELIQYERYPRLAEWMETISRRKSLEETIPHLS